MNILSSFTCRAFLKRKKSTSDDFVMTLTTLVRDRVQILIKNGQGFRDVLHEALLPK